MIISEKDIYVVSFKWKNLIIPNQNCVKSKTNLNQIQTLFSTAPVKCSVVAKWEADALSKYLS